MTMRALVAGLVFGTIALPLAAVADESALREYDRESLDSLFEQAQSGGPIPGLSEDDMLITGSIGSDDKKDAPSNGSGEPVPASRPSR